MGAEATEPSHLRFGGFELDLTTGELRKAGVLIHLPPQPFKILALLASRAGRLVTREEIQQQIWGNDTFVDFDPPASSAGLQVAPQSGATQPAPQPIAPYVSGGVPRRAVTALVDAVQE